MKNFSSSQCGLSIRIYIKPESAAVVVDDVNITMTVLRIICIYIRYAFGKRDILSE